MNAHAITPTHRAQRGAQPAKAQGSSTPTATALPDFAAMLGLSIALNDPGPKLSAKPTTQSPAAGTLAGGALNLPDETKGEAKTESGEGAADPAAQLVLNAAWSWVFFGLRRPGWGFVEIAALWGAILATTVSLLRVSLWSGLLFVPYLLWVTFAAGLNFAIWRLNRDG